MIDKIEGLILRISEYKDNDQMLFVITNNKGFLTLVSKSSRKILAKNHYFEGSIYEFTIDYKDTKTIYSIHNSKLIKSYYDLNNTLLFSFKNILFEALLKSKDLYEEKMYTNILFVLKNINNDNAYLLGSLFFSYLLGIHGIKPNTDECVVCKSKKVVSISNRFGGFLCLEHLNGEKIQDIETLKTFRLISKGSFLNYDVIKDYKVKLSDFSLFVDFFIANSSINLKTYEFYKRVTL